MVATLLSLVLAGFCLFMANLITYGLYSWTEPKLDPAVILPLVGIGLVLPLGPGGDGVGATPGVLASHRPDRLCSAGSCWPV